MSLFSSKIASPSLQLCIHGFLFPLPLPSQIHSLSTPPVSRRHTLGRSPHLHSPSSLRRPICPSKAGSPLSPSSSWPPSSHTSDPDPHHPHVASSPDEHTLDQSPSSSWPSSRLTSNQIEKAYETQPLLASTASADLLSSRRRFIWPHASAASPLDSDPTRFTRSSPIHPASRRSDLTCHWLFDTYLFPGHHISVDLPRVELFCCSSSNQVHDCDFYATASIGSSTSGASSVHFSTQTA